MTLNLKCEYREFIEFSEFDDEYKGTEDDRITRVKFILSLNNNQICKLIVYNYTICCKFNDPHILFDFCHENGTTEIILSSKKFCMSSSKSTGDCSDTLTCSFELTENEHLQFTDELIKLYEKV